jgi:hypothetical protein
MRTRTSRRTRCAAVAICLAALCAAVVPASAGAATLIGDYTFQNTLAASSGPGAPLTDVGSGTSSYATETVDGTPRTVLTFPRGNGVRFSTADALDEYTVVILMRFETMTAGRGGRYNRVTDVTSRQADEGLYFFNGRLEFYPFTAGSTAIANDEWVEVGLSRDSLGFGNVYVNGNLEGTFDDTATEFAKVTDSINFFVDDTESTPNEDSAGAVSRIQIFGEVLTQDEIDDLPEPTADTDGDGFADDADNCPAVANAGQEDVDGDGQGDACDTFDNRDGDGDGISNGGDNCPSDANAEQTDTDGDLIGDACDTQDNGDSDGDGVQNHADNCVDTPNPGQEDTGGNELGDACDGDQDGVANAQDNCANAANADQADVDGDGDGDACDSFDDRDTDGDGVKNGADNCIDDANADQADVDGDGAGNACDAVNDLDLDNDGTNDDVDNCAGLANSDQIDTDADGQGDACDTDDDGDGFADGSDACSKQFGTAANGCPMPTKKDQCKLGGWRQYGATFRNEGDCVSFIATLGKNQPAPRR